MAFARTESSSAYGAKHVMLCSWKRFIKTSKVELLPTVGQAAVGVGWAMFEVVWATGVGQKNVGAVVLEVIVAVCPGM